jgi:two-component system chemotaxis response regulator CheB
MTAGQRDVVAVGASAGGVEALRALVAGLPADYTGVLLFVLHLPREGPSALPAIIDRSGPLPASSAVDGDELRSGHIYIAPNDRHLLVGDGRVRLSDGATENGHRPSVDALFRSVARAYTRRAIGVVLSGARDDGAAGLALIAAQGGTTVVQDPADALYPSMPLAAMTQVRPDHVVPAAEMGALLHGIALDERPRRPPPGDPGAHDGGGLEVALQTALRALEEKSALSRRMAAGRAERRSATGMRYREITDETDAAVATIRQLIARIGAEPPVPEVR